MKRNLTALLTVAMLGWAGYASAQAKKADYLTNAQLKALLSDTITVRFTRWYNRSGTGVFQKDGTARLDAAGGVMVGSWKIEGNKLYNQGLYSEALKKYAEAIEPANLQQCFSSSPFRFWR